MTMRLVRQILSDNATVSATSQAGALVAANLQNPVLAHAWRSTSLSSQTITFDFGSATAIRMGCVWAHNLTSAGTIRVRGSSSSGLGSPLIDITQNVQPSTRGNNHNVFWFEETSARFWGFTLSNSGNPDGFMQAGRAFFSDYWEPSKDLNFGISVKWEHAREAIRLRSKALIPPTEPTFRIVKGELHAMTHNESDSGTLMDIDYDRSRGQDMLISVYPGDTTELGRRHTVYGYITRTSGLERPDSARNRVEFDFEETV